MKRLLLSTSITTPHILSSCRLALPLISTSSGRCFDGDQTALDLLSAVVNDILKQPLRLEKVADGCINFVKISKSSKCKVISFGPNNAENAVMKALELQTDAKVVAHEDPSTQIPAHFTPFGDVPRTSKKPKLAIVGMAGRFPNAADHEKFWSLLEAGLDVHKKVWHFFVLADAY